MEVHPKRYVNMVEAKEELSDRANWQSEKRGSIHHWRSGLLMMYTPAEKTKPMKRPYPDTEYAQGALGNAAASEFMPDGKVSIS